MTMRFTFAHLGTFGLFAFACYFVASSSAALKARDTVDFNADWRFTRSDVADAATPAFDDVAWECVSVPHTFNDIDTFDNWSPSGHRGESEQWSGCTWYRKTFPTSLAWRSKKVFIEFEGARQIAEVWFNGKKLGVSKTGFSPFGFDLTPHLHSDGQSNVLAVMVDNRFMKDPDPNAKLVPGQDRVGSLHDMLSKMERDMPENIEDLQARQIPWNNPHWHPAHGGLYRNVRLHIADPLHITLPLYSFLETEGPYAYATYISAAQATIGIDIPIRNDRAEGENVFARVEIYDADGKCVFADNVTRYLAPGRAAKLNLCGDITSPRLWEPDYPHLYRVVCSLAIGDKIIDCVEIPLGIRTVRWTADEGFFINGHHLKLRGWGQKPTDEWPGLGAAQPDWLHAYTMRLMRDAGANFVRWGHAAAGPASITAGDRLGIIALQPGADGEKDTAGAAWKLRASLFRDIIIYYRNNPSILIWEGGNQKVTREHAAELRGYMDTYDPHGGRAYAHRRADEITAESMDIGIGTEGRREIARMPVVEGEYNREESPRRVWDDQSPPTFGYAPVPDKVQTYRLNSEQFAVNQVRHWINKLGPKAHSGGANWIFSDSTSGGRVETEVARASGEVDGVRLPKEAYYVCQVMWTAEPRVHIIGHWTYPPGTKKTVYVVANNEADCVELFLNGKPLDCAKPEQTYLFSFAEIAFAPGELEAVSYRDGQKLAAHALRTAGPAVALRMTAITNPDTGFVADGSDIALIDVEAIDAEGNRCPTWQGRVDFTLQGPAIWRGGYNSGKTDTINNTWLDLECGINRIAIKSTLKPGKITLMACAATLKSARLPLVSRPVSSLPDSPIKNSVHAGWTSALQKAPDWKSIPSLATPQPALVKITASAGKMLGRFTKTFSYSGPGAAIVELANDAQPGRNAYADKSSPFSTDLPASLKSADWIQTANADALYSAVDFVEIVVPAGVTIMVAHDDRLSRPSWLTSQFEATPQKIIILGQPMTLFARTAKSNENVTMGDNVEIKSEAAVQPNMYLVFINKAKK